jgi:beta-lactamase superfamily II metal-dependent hydrolase
MQNKVFKCLIVFIICNILVLTGFVTNSAAQLYLTAKKGTLSTNVNHLIVYIINVGSGNCVLVKFPNGEFMLVDCGTTGGGIGKDNVKSLITQLTNGTTIKTILVSHPDIDHYSYIPAIDEAQHPEFLHLVYSQQDNDYNTAITKWNIKIHDINSNSKFKLELNYEYFVDNKLFNNLPCCDGNFLVPGTLNTTFNSTFTSDQSIYIDVLAAAVPGNTNDRSIVLAIHYGQNFIILPGDATFATELAIKKKNINKYQFPDLLLVGHHGSNLTSSSAAFINNMAPKIAVYSAAGFNSVHRHPQFSVLDTIGKCKLSNQKNCVIENNVDSIIVTRHTINCWDDHTQKNFYTVKGQFSTAESGNIMYITDGKGAYELYQDVQP